MGDTFNPYKVLGVSPGASMQEVKSRYRELSRMYHPDSVNGDSGKFQEVSKAWKMLKDGNMFMQQVKWRHRTLLRVYKEVM